METYSFLLDISLILIFTKLFGVFTKKLHMPQIVGALLGGLILGPSLLGLVHETMLLGQLAEIGVILLMFIAGMETNIKSLFKNGKASIIIAILGIVIPLAGGAVVSYFSKSVGENLLENIFIGVVLSATSVSITVQTLKEMGKLNTKVSDTILGAAILDDILGIVILAFISGLSNMGVNQSSPGLWITIIKIVLFFVFAAVMWYALSKWFKEWFSETEKGLRRYAVAALATCFILSFLSEHFFGVANIIGAFLAGLIFSDNQKNHYIMRRSETMSYMFFAPIFFASVGLKADIAGINSNVLMFALVLTIVAIVTKLIGCGIAAKACGFNNRDSVRIGAGMVSRGEVALIIANKGIVLGLAGAAILSPIIIMVVITTVITPILLKILYREKQSSKINKKVYN